MKKAFFVWLIALTSLLVLTSCVKQDAQEEVKGSSNQLEASSTTESNSCAQQEPQEEVKENSDQSEVPSANQSSNVSKPEEFISDKYILKESEIAQFPEVPDWNPLEFESQMDQGRAIPQFLIDEYKNRGNLDGNSMHILLPNGEDIAKLSTLKSGEYCYSSGYSYGDNVALFQNSNGSITVFHKSTSCIGRKFLGYEYDTDGKWTLRVVHMDYLDNSYGKLIDYTNDFTIIYYPETSEAVCIRYGKEIGPRTKIDSNLLLPGSFSYEYSDGTMRYNDGFIELLCFGFLNENRLIYPILLKNGEETSFHLYTAKVLDRFQDGFDWITIKGIDYPIYQGNAYLIQNVVGSVLSPIRKTILVVEDSSIHLQVQDVDSILSSLIPEMGFSTEELESKNPTVEFEEPSVQE